MDHRIDLTRKSLDATLIAGLPRSAVLRSMTKRPRLLIPFVSDDLAPSDVSSPVWDFAEEAVVGWYWNGENAPADRHFSAGLIWSGSFFYVRFEAMQGEPLVISNEPILTHQTDRLWDRDVCEIFVAPNSADQNRYFEFEVAPTGEWIDLAIDYTSGERVTDCEFHSGMESAALIENDRVIMAIRIPWTAFGKVPEPGDVWLGNIFRCVGEGETRGYLAWQATETAEPNFHVPSRFGELEFVK